MLYTQDNIDELRQYPATDKVYFGKMQKPLTIYREYDLSGTSYPSIELEAGDDVLVTVDHDGTGRVHFMSHYRRQFHYLAPIPETPFGGIVTIEKEL